MSAVNSSHALDLSLLPYTANNSACSHPQSLLYGVVVNGWGNHSVWGIFHFILHIVVKEILLHVGFLSLVLSLEGAWELQVSGLA